jgi:hypothetical protein
MFEQVNSAIFICYYLFFLFILFIDKVVQVYVKNIIIILCLLFAGMNGLLDHRKGDPLAPQPEQTTSAPVIQPQQVVLQHQTVDEVDYAIVNKVKPAVTAIISTELLKPRYDIAQSQIQEEIREVEMLNAVVQQTLNNTNNQNNTKRIKKKSVSFCDQVILVATADDEEDCDFVPNPILERVLKGANSNSQSEGDTETQEVAPSKEQKTPLNHAPPKEPAAYMSAQHLQSDPNQRSIMVNKMQQQPPTPAQLNLVTELQKQNQPVMYQQYYAMNQPMQKTNQERHHENNQQQQQLQHQIQMQQQANKSMYQQPQMNGINNVQAMRPLQQQYHQEDAKLMHMQQMPPHLQINRSNVATIAPNQHLQMKSEIPMMQQQYHDEMKASLQGFSNNNSPYMTVPHHPQLQATRSDGMQMYPGAILASRLNAQQKLENFINNRTNGNLQVNTNNQMYQKLANNPSMHQPQHNQQLQQNENGYVTSIQDNGHPINSLPFNNYQFNQQQSHIPSAYQRLPITAASAASLQQQQTQNNNYQLQQMPQMNSVYMSPPMRTIGLTPLPANATQKKVSFEPGTKGGDLESSLTAPQSTLQSCLSGGQLQQQSAALGIPLATTQMNQTGVQTRVAIPTYNGTAIVKASAKAVQCNLCRKKHVIAPSMYCTDCEFYMSKFQPRR